MTRPRAMVARVSEEHGQRLPRGYWGRDQTRPILDKVLVTPYDVALHGLAAGERRAVDELLEAGLAIRDLDEETQHHQAAARPRPPAGPPRPAGSPEADRRPSRAA